MNYFVKLFHFSSWYFIIFFTIPTLAMPKLRTFRKIKIQQKLNSSINDYNSQFSSKNDVKILYYPQTLDHFNYQPQSYLTFKQKYMVYSKHWGGAKENSPILVYLGDEAPMANNEIDYLILPDYAAKLQALVVIIEHRYYGDSKPFGLSMDEILKNASVRGYFNSAQAIADYAEVILHLKEELKAHYSPVIVVGGSYGGMLASWFRLKYPHIALGALAASAPVLYFDDIISPNQGYYFVVTKDFKDASESCYKTIKKSWDIIIDSIGSNPDGLSYLSKKFNTCDALEDKSKIKSFLETMYDTVTQYGDLTINATTICNAIDKGSNGSNVLDRIHAGILAFFDAYLDESHQHYCLDTNYFAKEDVEMHKGYNWQTCSEMVMPVVRGTSKWSMFQPETFNLQEFMKDCKEKYNVVPRPHWITTYYGGHDMKLILEKFGSNIIYSNGLKDPYSSAGVLYNLSDSIIALYTTQGSHCQDISSAEEDDPVWLINQREKEVEIISGWIKQYNQDLKELA